MAPHEARQLARDWFIIILFCWVLMYLKGCTG